MIWKIFRTTRENYCMKIPALALCAALFMASCSSTKTPEANLPKDISERPTDENSQKYDQAQLDKMRTSIESEISKEKCGKKCSVTKVWSANQLAKVHEHFNKLIARWS